MAGGPNVRRGVHSLNTTCKTVGVLNGFRGIVVDHENRHQNSLNDCILVVNHRRMSHVEGAVGDRDRVKDVLEETWYPVADDLEAARTTKQDPFESNGDAHWYYGSTWWFSPLTARGHSGTDGC